MFFIKQIECTYSAAISSTAIAANWPEQCAVLGIILSQYSRPLGLLFYGDCLSFITYGPLLSIPTVVKLCAQFNKLIEILIIADRTIERTKNHSCADCSGVPFVI